MIDKKHQHQSSHLSSKNLSMVSKLLRLSCSLLVLATIECFLQPQCINSIRNYRNSVNVIGTFQEQESSNPKIHRCGSTSSCLTTLKAVDKDEGTKKSNLTSLGYTDEEIQLSQDHESRRQQKGGKFNVQVNLLPDIDSVTLTAVGFALIAFNFFVLGNLEDGGIAGVVATIINTLSQ